MNPILFQSPSLCYPSSLTLEGWTQLISIKERAQNQSEGTHWQWKKRWSIDCSSSRHTALLLGKLKFLFLSMTSVATSPVEAAQGRKQAFVGALYFQIAFGGKWGQLDPSSLLHRLVTETVPLESRDQIILSSPSEWTSTSKSASKYSKLRMFPLPNHTLFFICLLRIGMLLLQIPVNERLVLLFGLLFSSVMLLLRRVIFSVFSTSWMRLHFRTFQLICLLIISIVKGISLSNLIIYSSYIILLCHLVWLIGAVPLEVYLEESNSLEGVFFVWEMSQGGVLWHVIIYKRREIFWSIAALCAKRSQNCLITYSCTVSLRDHCES